MKAKLAMAALSITLFYPNIAAAASYGDEATNKQAAAVKKASRQGGSAKLASASPTEGAAAIKIASKPTSVNAVKKSPLNAPSKNPAGDPIDTYIKLVSPKIQGAWKAPDKTTAEKVIVSLTIEQSGKIKSVTIKEPSGDQAFDDATVASLSAIGQLPAMPASAKDGMTLNYTFNAGNRNQATKADNEMYVDAFSRKVNSAWRNPKVEKNCKVSVAITVDKTGKLLKAEIAKSSGVKPVDDAGLSAARLAEPYPVIPASLGERMTINYTFEAGPARDVVNKMKFNGVPLPQGDYTISAGGAQLRPLDVDTSVNRKLQEREAKVQERFFNLKNSLTQQVAKFGAQSVQAAKAQHELANCAVELHDYKEAESNYKMALPTVENDATQLAELQSLLHDFAQMYAITARLKEAEPLMSRAVEIGKTGSGIDIQQQRKAMEDYARLLYKLNRTAEADGLYKQLKEMR
ncbi:MAG: TonB family protein [Candidatus Obscuribacterales bacterium]|nr:TonB family protein [Candidatus Obscuribacterales bacterium]